VEFLLNFCTREYNTVVTNGEASTNETVVMAAPQSNATLNIADPSHVDLSWIFFGYARSGDAETDIADLFAQTVYKTPGDMTQLFSIMKNVATSLTNTYIFLCLPPWRKSAAHANDKKPSIRTDAGDGSTVIGTAHSYELYVLVRWQWFTFLGALVLASGVQLVGTMLQSQRTGTAIWKSSILAPLLAPDGPTRSRDMVMQSQKGMEASSKRAVGQLRRNGQSGWTLLVSDSQAQQRTSRKE